MSEVNIDEMDLDSMSIEELDSLLNETEGKGSVETETKETQQEEKEETIETSEAEESSENQESEPEESTEGETEKKDSNETEDIEPQYQGKSKDDLLEMQRNANRKISQQNNEIYHLKKRIEEIAENTKKQTQEIKTSAEDDLLSNYAEEDKKAINLLLEKALAKKEQEELDKKTAQIEQVRQEHDKMWDDLALFNPALFSSIKDKAMDTMKADIENTYHKKGWLKKFITENNKGTETAKPVSKPKVKKVATTISSSGASITGQIINKRVDDMSPDEYVQHMASQGIKI